MAELADALDSGSSEQYVHAGSSPVSRTTKKALVKASAFFNYIRFRRTDDMKKRIAMHRKENAK